jgi:VanZ family protein
MLNTGEVPFLVKNSDTIDVIENIALFAPFGVLLFAWLRGWFQSSELAIRLAVIAAGLVSVVCEAFQYFEPARYSAIYDVGANVIGAAAGAIGCWFGFLLAEKLRRRAKLVG